MKKIICFLVTVLLVLSVLCGCQNGVVQDSDPESSVDNSSEEVVSTVDEYDNGLNVVEHNRVVYCADETGLWMSNGDTKEYLYSKSAVRNIAVCDEHILFSTYDADKVSNTGDLLEADCTIHIVNADGTDERELFETIDIAKPICIYDNKLYYTDIKDIYSVETLAQTMWLKSYDLDSEDEMPLAENVADAVSIGNRIVYKNMGLDIADKLMTPHCYNISDDSITDIGEMSCSELYKRDNSVYFTSYKYDDSGSDTIASIYSYDPFANSLVELFSNYAAIIRDLNDQRAIIGTADYADGRYECYDVSLSDGSETKIEGLPEDKMYDACYCGDGIFFIDNETMNTYYYNDGEIKKVKNDFDRGFMFRYHNGAFYYNSYDTGELMVSSWSFSEDQIMEEEDYSYLLGWWNKDFGQGAGIGVNFVSVDENVVTFELNTSTYNANKIVTTDEITAAIIDNQIKFQYFDSWQNNGSGIITLNEDSIYITAGPDGEVTTGYALYCDSELVKQ